MNKHFKPYILTHHMSKINKKMLLAAWSVNNPYWIINQAYHIPLRKIFKEVINFDPQEEIYKDGKEVMNKKFLELLKKEKPDYIHLFLVWDEFYPETLVKIKEILPNVKVTHWNGDDDIKFENYTIPYSFAIDYQLISQLQFTKKYDSYKLPWYDLLGADTNKFRPLNLKKKYDVVFVGTPKGDRLKYMRYLLKKKVNFAIGGAGWDIYPEFKNQYIGKVPDEEFIKLINETKINLCFSQNFFSSPHVLERSLAVNACKSFALTEYVSGYFPKFTEGKDMVTFKNEDELLKRISYYLEHEKEREQIAKQAYEKVITKFSNDKMMGDAFSLIEKDKNKLHGIVSRTFLFQKPVCITQEDFAKGVSHITDKLRGAKYVSFNKKGYDFMPYKDYIQMYSMDLIKKPISVCNLQLSSSVIGDYASVDLNYVLKYHDKKYFYENLDITQCLVEKNFFLKNINKFDSFYNGNKSKFITSENTSFVSIPLVRTTHIKEIPLKNSDHILFADIDLKLLVLRNQGRLFKNIYLIKLLFYSLIVNSQILKYLLSNVLGKSKSKYHKKISKIFNHFFK